MQSSKKKSLQLKCICLFLGDTQEGDVTAVQRVPYQDPSCGCSRNSERWGGRASHGRAVKQWATNEEVHADFCACSGSKYM